MATAIVVPRATGFELAAPSFTRRLAFLRRARRARAYPASGVSRKIRAIGIRTPASSCGAESVRPMFHRGSPTPRSHHVAGNFSSTAGVIVVGALAIVAAYACTTLYSPVPEPVAVARPASASAVCLSNAQRLRPDSAWLSAACEHSLPVTAQTRCPKIVGASSSAGRGATTLPLLIEKRRDVAPARAPVRRRRHDLPLVPRFASGAQVEDLIAGVCVPPNRARSPMCLRFDQLASEIGGRRLRRCAGYATSQMFHRRRSSRIILFEETRRLGTRGGPRGETLNAAVAIGIRLSPMRICLRISANRWDGASRR